MELSKEVGIVVQGKSQWAENHAEVTGELQSDLNVNMFQKVKP